MKRMNIEVKGKSSLMGTQSSLMGIHCAIEKGIERNPNDSPQFIEWMDESRQMGEGLRLASQEILAPQQLERKDPFLHQHD